VYRNGQDEFYAKALEYKKFRDNMSDRNEYCKFVMPRYQRTRCVQVKRRHQNGEALYLSCTCLCYEENGYGCQHIFAVLGQSMPPSPNDVVIRWHKSYDQFYMKGDEEADRLFDDLFVNEKPGPSARCDSISNFRSNFMIGHGEKPLSFVLSALPGKTPLLQPGIKWANAVSIGQVSSQQQLLLHAVQQMPSAGGGGLRQMVSLSQHAVAGQFGSAQQGARLKDDGDNDSFSGIGAVQDDFDDDDGDDDDDVPDNNFDDNDDDNEGDGNAASTSVMAALGNAVSDESLRVAAVQEALKKTSVYNLFKSRVEQLAGLVGSQTSFWLLKFLWIKPKAMCCIV
jgi:SWIM zinc finger